MRVEDAVSAIWCSEVTACIGHRAYRTFPAPGSAMQCTGACCPPPTPMSPLPAPMRVTVHCIPRPPHAPARRQPPSLSRPAATRRSPGCDLLIVDGGHKNHQAMSGIANMRALANRSFNLPNHEQHPVDTTGG